MLMETWRPIMGHPGYEVSDHGRVRSWRARGSRIRLDGSFKRREEPLILTPWTLPKGYQVVALTDGQRAYVHELVLIAFVGPRPDGLEGCHEDNDPSNNVPSNLRWDTHASNQGDRALNGTFALNPDQVRTIRLAVTSREAAQLTGVSWKTCNRIRSGQTYRKVT